MIELFDGLADLPHFNPDLDVEPAPPQVTALREAVRRGRRTDHLLAGICAGRAGLAQERARLAGLAATCFREKPVALFNASDRGVAMQAALRLTLETMSARMVDVATITLPLLGKQTDAAAIAADPEGAAKIRGALEAYARFLA